MAPRAKKAARKAASDDDDDDAYGSDDTVMQDEPAQPAKKKRVTQFLVPITNGEETFTDQRRVQRRSSFKAPNTSTSALDDSNMSMNGHPPKTPHRRLSQLNAVPMTPALPASLEIMSSNYEEWMKMATDNKINAANSWNFALIDYFADMSLLRNDVDKSINFQKASCTLDGCVKIWTSRVDSVGTATGQLLSNLANDGRDEEEAGEGEEGEEGEGGAEGGKKRKAHRPEATLAKSSAQLRAKKPDLDLDFTVDPLFKKTRADFDEGGAGGLLMNHLGVDGSMRVIFDSGDSTEGQDCDEEEPVDLLDLSELRREFFPSLDGLEDLAISHSLESFSFDKDLAATYDATYMNETFRDDMHSIAEDDDDGFGDATFRLDGDGSAPMDVGADGSAAPPVEDFFSGDQAVPDYDDFMPPMDDGSFEGDHSGEGGETTATAGASASSGFGSFNPSQIPNERDFTMALTEGDEGMMDYFDSGFLKNWAGPEHWKVRRVFRRPDTSAEKSTEVKQRKEKKVFRIDFSAPPERTAKELFAPVTRGAGITLSALARPSSTPTTTKGKRKAVAPPPDTRDNHILPDDMHFSSKELVTLFLKPKFSLKMRGQAMRGNGEEVDEHFWARAAAEQAAGLRAHDDGDETGEGGAVPFNTQFFHDDYDDGPGFDDVFDGDMATGVDATDVGQEEDLLAATQGQTRRVRPQAVNYSKRAKRVDVRKLKENIWKNLDIVVAHSDDKDKDESEDDIQDDRPPTDPSEARVFSDVIDGLKQSYPKEKMEEISSSFCFICLLHLANEQGLKILKNESEEMDGEEGDDGLNRPVGDLRTLQVFRDPTATRAA